MNLLDSYNKALNTSKAMTKRFHSLKTETARINQSHKLMDHNFQVLAPLIDTVLEASTHVEITAFPVSHCWKDGGYMIKGTYPISQINTCGVISLELTTADGKDVFHIDLSDTRVHVNFYNLEESFE